jgi:hypothetical protein
LSSSTAPEPRQEVQIWAIAVMGIAFILMLIGNTLAVVGILILIPVSIYAYYTQGSTTKFGMPTVHKDLAKVHCGFCGASMRSNMVFCPVCGAKQTSS